ncbi:hypothetical protein TUM17387_24000 [Shewanella carassii]|uniref:Uncharacterized protein n=1 Tax=Shewanella carassii TaxID=1987584 RepID=A0ABQ1T467_9GAMM|nr:hypothetical protein TUM17387_24000 [Shewanella carassii]GGE79461.1 hypothetical protein GCM10011520_20020 [Shewanella carassii]
MVPGSDYGYFDAIITENRGFLEAFERTCLCFFGLHGVRLSLCRCQRIFGTLADAWQTYAPAFWAWRREN